MRKRYMNKAIIEPQAGCRVDRDKSTNVKTTLLMFFPSKSIKIIWLVSGAKARFFGFAKIVTERGFVGILIFNNKNKVA